MTSLSQITDYLERLFPLDLAEEWDRVGLLLGRRDREIRRILCCLSISPSTVGEAVRERIDLIVSHHPFPFHPIARAVDADVSGELLLRLVENRIAVYSPHTAHDGGRGGVNEQWTERLGLVDVEPLRPARPVSQPPCSSAETGNTAEPSASALREGLGGGRIGRLPEPAPLLTLVQLIKKGFGLPACRYVGTADRSVSRLAVACGAADDFLDDAHAHGAEALVLGEARFHTALRAESLGVALILPGHYASERFAMERLAERLAADWPGIDCRPSRDEYDPERVY